MKIKQIEKGLAKPIDEILPKLNKIDSNSESSDAFDIILSFFTNSINISDTPIQQNFVPNEKQEYFKNSQVNLFFQQLFKDINNQIPADFDNIKENLSNNSSVDISMPKALIEQVINLKNLAQQNRNLNDKIAKIIVNSLPNEIIEFLKINKIELTSNTQNELLQIVQLFERIHNNKNKGPNDQIKSTVIDNKETQAHIIENIEDNLTKIEKKDLRTNGENTSELPAKLYEIKNSDTNQILREKTDFSHSITQAKLQTIEQKGNVNKNIELKNKQKQTPQITTTVIDNKETEAHIIENIEDNLTKIEKKDLRTNGENTSEHPANGKTFDKLETNQVNKDTTDLPKQDTQSKITTNERISKLSVLTPKDIAQEQAALKKVGYTDKNLENNNIEKNRIDLVGDIKSTGAQNNNGDYYSEEFSEKSKNSQDSINYENKIISQEVKQKSNIEFLTPKINNFVPKAGNYTIFSSVRPNEIPNYILRMSNSIKESGNYRAIMNLKPENLGSIFVNLSMKDDVLNIIIRTEMQQTLEKIDSSVAQLKEALVSTGFKSENINLRVESNQPNEQNYTNSNKGFDSSNKQKQNQELRDLIQRIHHYEHILSEIKQQEVVE